MNVLHLFIDLITLAVVLYFIFRPGKYEVWLTTPVSGNWVKMKVIPRIGEVVRANEGREYAVTMIEHMTDGTVCITTISL